MSIINGNSKVLRGAIQILMQSPIYVRMPLAERKILVHKLSSQLGVVCEFASSQVHKSAPPKASIVEDISSETTYLALDLN